MLAILGNTKYEHDVDELMQVYTELKSGKINLIGVLVKLIKSRYTTKIVPGMPPSTTYAKRVLRYLLYEAEKLS